MLSQEQKVQYIPHTWYIKKGHYFILKKVNRLLYHSFGNTQGGLIQNRFSSPAIIITFIELDD